VGARAAGAGEESVEGTGGRKSVGLWEGQKQLGWRRLLRQAEARRRWTVPVWIMSARDAGLGLGLGLDGEEAEACEDRSLGLEMGWGVSR